MTTRNRPLDVTITLFATAFAVGLAVLIPLTFFVISYQYMLGSLDVQAEVNANAVSGLIMSNPDMWRFEEVRMMELLERRSRTSVAETRRVLDPKGEVVAESVNHLPFPVLSRRHDIYDAGTKVAEIEISQTLRPLLGRTALIAAGSLLIGLILFFVLRVLPLRALRRAHHSLEESEQKYRSLFVSMREGVALHRFVPGADGLPESLCLIDVNPAAEKLLSAAREALLGMDARDIYGDGMISRLPAICRAAGSDETVSFELALPEEDRFYNISTFFPDKDLCAMLLEDITERRRAEAQIQSLAYYDTLTGLPNRSLFSDRLDQALARATRDKARIALLFLDLDRFKNVNDSLGHGAGDNLLQQVTQRLQRALRRSDTIARIGGDEFVILLSATGEQVDAAHVAQNLLDNLSDSYLIDNRQIFASASIGIAVFPEDGRDAGTLLRCADMAMYAAKDSGRNCYHFYSREMDLHAHELMDLEMSLRQAVEREEFFLEFQPIVSVKGGHCIGVEALVRWRHPSRGVLMPGTFILMAEESGIIVPLGEWVLREACRAMKRWQEAGLPPVRVAVNISGRQFALTGFTALLSKIIAETAIDPRYLELEMTETMLMEGGQTVNTLRALKKLKVEITIDDFGAGYSSLGYLKRFPIDRLKIDRSFIQELSIDSNDCAIVEAIIAMGGKLGLEIVAEGVETQEQASFLGGAGCDAIQGYYYHRPLPEDRLISLLKEVGAEPIPCVPIPEAVPA